MLPVPQTPNPDTEPFTDVRGLRSLAETEPRVVPAELVVVVVEGAYIQELTVASIAAPPARLPRGPFVKGYG